MFRRRKDRPLDGRDEGDTLIPKDYEDFAWWIIEKLKEEAILEVGWNVYDNYYPEEEIKAAIRRILMENEMKEIK